MADDTPEVERTPFLRNKHAAALERVKTWLSNEVPNAAPLNRAGLLALGRDEGWAGWKLPLHGGRTGRLLLLLDADFPYSLPRFFLDGCSELLLAPHVETRGRLCLAGDGGRVDALDPVAVVRFSYDEALSLIEGNEAGQNREDFLLDFEAYWLREANLDRPVRTWVRQDRRSRKVTAWHGEKFYLIAETIADCRTWMNNRYGPGEERSFCEAAVIGLDRLPEPPDYPTDAGSARRMIAAHSPDGLQIFDDLMASMHDRAVVVLVGTTTLGGLAQAPLVIGNPTSVSDSKAPKQLVSRGFRPGRTPANILSLRRTAKRAHAERIDAWLSRMRAGEGVALADKRVVVLGCGSLGAGVVKLLLQSGVGRMQLVDPDCLAWENLGRHELGADSVGMNKASALASRFRAMYPHVRELQAEGSSWQALLRRAPNTFVGADLVLSLTGDWNSESSLNDLQRAGTGELSSPVIYGWLEQQAGAAHALAIGIEGACFRCGFDAVGTVRAPATRWPRDRPVACGAPTSIYGAVELAPAHALVANLAVDLLLGSAAWPVRRTWLAPRAVLEQGGGSWHPGWVERHGDPDSGGKSVATPWPEDRDCPYHRQQPNR